MASRCGLVVVVAVIVASASGARARPVDGCPPREKPREFTFGFANGDDAVLGPSAAKVDVSEHQLRWAGAGDPPTEYHQDWMTLLRTGVGVRLANGLSFDVRYARVYSRDADLTRNGNLGVAVGYRKTWLDLGDAVRGGVAIQLGEAFSTRHNDLVTADDGAQLHVLRRMPFYEMDVAPGDPVQVAVEGRFELVGCHVPFVHFRAALQHWNTADEPAAYVIPIDVTLGGYERDAVGLAGFARLDLRTPKSLFLARRLTEVGVVLELRLCRGFHLQLYGAAISGNLSGLEAGVNLGVTKPYWRSGRD